MKFRWLFGLLLLASVWFLLSHRVAAETLVTTLAQGEWQWVVIAAALQAAYFIVYTALYQSAFSIVDVPGRIRQLLPLTFGSFAVSVLVPSVGPVGGAALFIDDAVRRGYASARAALGTVLTVIADFGAFMLVLIPGLAYLLLKHDLKAYEVVAALMLLLLFVGLNGLILISLARPRWLRAVLGWVHRLINRLATLARRGPLLPDDWAARNAAELSDAATAIRAYPRRVARTLGIAFVGHLIDLASLYVLFVAFRAPVTPGLLVAGYAMGILFLIISPTPQGIGVVEGVMALVFASLGVPAAQATIIALSFRGLSFWLPLLVGFLMLGRLPAVSGQKRSLMEVWGVHGVALLTGIMGFVNVLSGVTPPLASRLALVEGVLPLTVRHGAHLTAALAGFALLLLAGSLWRRKRAAWLVTLIVLAISAASHLIKGLDYEEAILATLIAGWLLSLHAHFHVRSDPPSLRRGLRVGAAALMFTLAYGVAGFYLLDRHFSVKFDFVAALRQTVVMFTQFYDPGLQPLTPFGRYFGDSLYLVGVTTVGFALLMLVRPVLVRQPATGAERARARAIVEAQGRSSLARFTLFTDKSYYFSPGDSIIAYVVKGRVALTLGDPIGPAQDVSAAIAGFASHCEANDWGAAFYQTLPDFLPHYRSQGFHALHIGDEGIIDLTSFTLEGKAGKTLRAPVNRLTRLGYRAVLHEPPLPDGLLQELRTISDEWLTMMHGTEKRFSLGWFDDDYVRESAVMAVHSPEGWISAFANIVPEYQQNETTIDLMRRRREAEHGTMDFLFVSLFQWAKERGYATFNLGLSPLAGVGERSVDPVIEKALHYIFEHVNQFYNFKGLHAYKAKFHPIWSPRYLIYSSHASLPLVALAVIRADSGDLAGSHLKELLGSYLRRPRSAAETA